ncbi:MAG: hypothetical protein LBI29_02730 [Rickettsiales bacterium]|jgi:uncharacterized phiE125 gp8 family phage protein|nr:hypothetical protein [Rickettsiales bacterium]
MPIVKILEESDNLPINMENIRLFLKVDYEDEDELILRSFKTAIKQCELMIGQSLLEKEYKYSFYNGIKNKIHLMYGPVTTVESAQMISSKNEEISIDEEDYFLDSVNDNLIFKKVPYSFYRLDIVYWAKLEVIGDDLKQGILFHTAKIFEDKLGYSPIPRASYSIYKKYKTTRL